MAKKPLLCSASAVEGNAALKSWRLGVDVWERGNQFAVTILRIRLIEARATSLNAMILACWTRSANRVGLWLR